MDEDAHTVHIHKLKTQYGRISQYMCNTSTVTLTLPDSLHMKKHFVTLNSFKNIK